MLLAITLVWLLLRLATGKPIEPETDEKPTTDGGKEAKGGAIV